MDNELRERLKEIEAEDVILGLFVILIILTYIANQFEKKYFVNGIDEDKYKYYYIQSFVFFVVVLVNIYYVVISYKEVEKLKFEGYSKRKKYANLSLIASLAALVAGLIIFYIAVTDIDIDAEISL